MTHRPASLLPTLALSAIALASLAGCRLETSPILPWGSVTPSLVCPGDEVTASYDFLGTETCRNEELCAMFHPTVVVSSDPAAFAPQSFTGYRGSLSFTASADLTTVTFDPDRDAVRIPTSRVDAEGRPIDLNRTNVANDVYQVRRLTGTQATELVHDGMCSGLTPVNSPETLPGPPSQSPNLRLVSLCNRNGVPVEATLSGGAPGATYSQLLMPGDCLNTDAPGVPAGTDASRLVAVRPLFPDPGARCSATGPSTPPATLRTEALMACR